MSAKVRDPYQNRLLARLERGTLASFAAAMDYVELQKGTKIVDAGDPVEHVYFPERGIISIVATSPDRQRVEAGLFGRDGFGPVDALSSEQSANDIVVQVPCEAYRLPRTVLLARVEEDPALRALLWRYMQTLLVQISFTALSNAVHPVDERLARWLLMVHDRSDTHDLELTHEFIAVMLAVRRPSVTTSLHVLEGNGFIRAERGRITVRDRARMVEFASDAYGRAEAEYRRLIGPM